MPRGDRTGPNGMGPMTGRAAGFCAGFATPGINSGAGRGGFGGGRGMGLGRGFRGQGFGRGNAIYNNAAYAYSPEVALEQGLDDLKNQAAYLEDALNAIKTRIEALEK